MHSGAKQFSGSLLKRAVFSLIVSVCGTVLLPAQSQNNPRAIVIEGATLIDGTGSTPVPNATIVVLRNKIIAVGKAGTVKYPTGAEIINVNGQYIIPGLIDSHTHYPEWGGELFLAYGVTSVTDLGNSTEWIAALKQAFRSGNVRTPRIFSTGEFLAAPRSVSRGIRGEGGALTYMTYVADPDEARLAARRIISMGMDGLKLWQNLSPDQIRAIVEEARRGNVWVTGHAFNGKEAAELGYQRIEHTHALHNPAIKNATLRALFESGKAFSPSLMQPELFEPIIQTWMSKNVHYDPLLIFEYKAVTKRSAEFRAQAETLLNNPSLKYVPDDRRLAAVETYRTARETGLGVFEGPVDLLPASKQREYQEGYKKDQEFIRQFVKAGGKLDAGTDTAGSALIPGLSLHQELQMFVDAGLSPMQALLTATRNPADFLKQSNQLGTLEVGKLADLVILDADPLQDIANTKRISRVMLDGKFADISFHPDYTVPFGRPLPYGVVGIFPPPSLANISPRWSFPGKEAQIEVDGTGFTYASEVLVGDRPVPTKFVSPTRLSATIPDSRVQGEATYYVTVRNPKPGGGVSSPYGFVVFQNKLN